MDPGALPWVLVRQRSGLQVTRGWSWTPRDLGAPCQGREPLSVLRGMSLSSPPHNLLRPIRPPDPPPKSSLTQPSPKYSSTIHGLLNPPVPHSSLRRETVPTTPRPSGPDTRSSRSADTPSTFLEPESAPVPGGLLSLYYHLLHSFHRLGPEESPSPSTMGLRRTLGLSVQSRGVRLLLSPSHPHCDPDRPTSDLPRGKNPLCRGERSSRSPTDTGHNCGVPR